jgi:hypothetical protein
MGVLVQLILLPRLLPKLALVVLLLLGEDMIGLGRLDNCGEIRGAGSYVKRPRLLGSGRLGRSGRITLSWLVQDP